MEILRKNKFFVDFDIFFHLQEEEKKKMLELERITYENNEKIALAQQKLVYKILFK